MVPLRPWGVGLATRLNRKRSWASPVQVSMNLTLRSCISHPLNAKSVQLWEMILAFQSRINSDKHLTFTTHQWLRPRHRRPLGALAHPIDHASASTLSHPVQTSMTSLLKYLMVPNTVWVWRQLMWGHQRITSFQDQASTIHQLATSSIQGSKPNPASL